MTKELIVEAREFLRSENAQYYDSSLIGALADALEASPERVTENSVRHVKLLTTKLQNKREALNDQRREYRALLSKRDRAIDGLRAERDDLATRLSEYLCDSTGGLLSKTGYDVRTMVAHTEEYYDRVHAEERKEVEAERDVALAAIERIRQAVSGHPECDRYEEGDVISCGWKSAYASVVWALDGAPEPEWEWEYSPGHIDHRIESGAFVQGSVIAPGYVQQYIAEGGEVIKRKVSPWLPVEGESK